MKKKQITYGVSGMMEYQAVVKVGKKNVSINFSDGSISAMGTNPATYTTTSIVMQNAIEASNDFKRGRIHIVRTIELEEELHVIRNTKKAAPAAAPTPTPVTTETPAEDNAPEAPAEDNAPEAPANEQAVEVNAGTPEEGETSASITQVEFSCNDDARDYLEQKFGYVRSKLRNREDMVSAGKAHGIEIIFV